MHMGCRAGILEKLAHATVSSFDDVDLHQIFQAYLLLDQQSAQLPCLPSTSIPC